MTITGSQASDAAHLKGVTDLSIDLFGFEEASARVPDNADPHPVILTVHPREQAVDCCARIGISGPHEHEAEYEINVEHPDSCPGFVEECPVADYLDVIGIDRDLYAGFPEPDHLSDDDLAALNGTVRYVTITRTYSHSSGPYGDDWDVEYGFTWSD